MCLTKSHITSHPSVALLAILTVGVKRPGRGFFMILVTGEHDSGRAAIENKSTRRNRTYEGCCSLNMDLRHDNIRLFDVCFINTPSSPPSVTKATKLTQSENKGTNTK